MLRTDDRPARPELTEPVMAWRAWTLSTGRRGVRLEPIAGRRSAWPPGEPARASCPRHCRPVPGLLCLCGLYATRDPLLLRQARSPAAIGRVALWGRIVEHDHGYRAAFGYPARLALVCMFCFWQWGPQRARADVVARLRRGRLLPLCEPHVATANRYGFRTPDPTPAHRVQAALLDAYAVDVLPLQVDG
ncbi:MAG: hypothetical protein ACE14W_11105 [Candidatus Velamenicoccus archaeovorus]